MSPPVSTLAGALGASAFLLALCVSPPARAGEPTSAEASEPAVVPGPAEPDDDATRKGREAYQRGVELARAEQWGEALSAFQLAAEARDAPVVQFNIAYCLRALGRYVAAR